MDEVELLERITADPAVLDGRPLIRDRNLAVERILTMLAAGDPPEIILEHYPSLEPEDIQACLVYACRLIELER